MTAGGTDDNVSTSTIFGSIGQLNSVTLTIMIIIIVFSVLLVEKFFECLRKLTNDSPFRCIIAAVEEELMVVGFTAFVFKIVFSCNNFLTHEEFLSLEFADLLVPLFSICNCIIGIVLIFMSIFLCDIWSKAFHLKLHQLIDEFYDFAKQSKLRQIAAFSNIKTEMEFRIFHCIFCESFSIQRKAFAFDQYVQLVFEKHVIDIVKIQPINWLIFCALLLLNLFRSENQILVFINCNGSDIDCQKHRALVIFTYIGALLNAIVVIFAIYSRYYEVRIIRMRGISSSIYYPSFLQYMETLVEKPIVQQRRLNETDLKLKIIEAKNDSIRLRTTSYSDFRSHPMKALRIWFDKIFGQRVSLYKPRVAPYGSYSRHDVDNPPTARRSDEATGTPVDSSSIRDDSKDPEGYHPHDKRQSLEDVQKVMKEDVIEQLQANSGKSDEMNDSFYVVKSFNDVEAFHSGTHQLSSKKVSDDADELTSVDGLITPADEQEKLFDIEKQPVAPFSPLSCKSSKLELNSTVPQSPQYHGKEVPMTPDSRRSLTSIANYLSNLGSLKMNWNHVKDISFTRKNKLDNASQVFLFRSPDLYFGCVQLLVLFISMYFSLWMINFSFTGRTLWEKVYSLLPGIGSAIVYVYVVKSSALLKAIYQLDKDAMWEVMEQTEGSRQLGETLKDKLLTRLEVNLDNPKSELYSLFQDIDDQGRNKLRRCEFEYFMEAVGINFSRKKWQQIYREIDLNNDDMISFEEFFLFMCPDHDVAKALEVRRSKIVKNRATIKAIQFAETEYRLGRSSFTYKPRESFRRGGSAVISSQRSNDQLSDNMRARVISIARAVRSRLQRAHQRRPSGQLSPPKPSFLSQMQLQSFSRRNDMNNTQTNIDQPQIESDGNVNQNNCGSHEESTSPTLQTASLKRRRL